MADGQWILGCHTLAAAWGGKVCALRAPHAAKTHLAVSILEGSCPLRCGTQHSYIRLVPSATARTMTSAGVTPARRPACPSVPGRKRARVSDASLRRPGSFA
jgi:hypothetical protein